MSKSEVYAKELAKLRKIFADVEPAKAELVDGLILDAAFLAAENHELRGVIEKTGMVRIHPQDLSKQKPSEASRQYLKNVNSYAVVIKTLNGVLNKSVIEDDESLDEYE